MGNLSSKPERDVLMQDFYVVESIFFPRYARCHCAAWLLPHSHPLRQKGCARDLCSACISLARISHMTIAGCLVLTISALGTVMGSNETGRGCGSHSHHVSKPLWPLVPQNHSSQSWYMSII